MKIQKTKLHIFLRDEYKNKILPNDIQISKIKINYTNAKIQIVDDRINVKMEKLKAPSYSVDAVASCATIVDGFVECSIKLTQIGLYYFTVSYEETIL